MRIVILTGYDSIASSLVALKAGSVGYLAKPVSAEQVVAALLGQGDEAEEPAERPMSADRVRWEHIQRVFEQCNRNVSETAPPAEHASAHAAADPVQARAAPLTRACRVAAAPGERLEHDETAAPRRPGGRRLAKRQRRSPGRCATLPGET